MKALKITNWLRVQAGLPPVIPHHHGGPHFHGHNPGADGSHRMEMLDVHHQLPPPPFGLHPEAINGHFHSHPMMMPPQTHNFQDVSFMDRLANAIMSLGPWEGRAVAFVIGRSKISLLRAV